MFRFQKNYFLILLLLLSQAVFSQNLSEDEIAQIRTVQSLLISNPEKALAQSVEMSQSENEIFSLCGDYYNANYYYNKSDYGVSKKLLLKLIGRIEASGSLSEKRYQDVMAMSVNKLFYIHKNLGEYSEALVYLDRYKKNIPNSNFSEQYGIAKVALGDYANGIALLKRSLITSPHLKLGQGENKVMNDKLFADKYNAIGEAYQDFYIHSKKRTYIDSADFYFTKAADLMIADTFQPEYTEALLYMRKAKSAALTGNFSEALALYRKRHLYPVINENIRTVQLFDLGMADCFYHLQQLDSAVIYAKRYINNYEKTKISKENLLIAHNILSKSYNARKDSKNAYAYAQKSLALIESIDNIKSRSLHFLHNYDLESIKKESNDILARKNYFKASLFGILLVLIVVGCSFYYYYTNQKKKHERFLKIIRQLKTAPVNQPETPRQEPILKQALDEDFIEKTTIGLKKLETKEAYLKPNFKLGYIAKKLNTNTAYLSQYFNQVMQKTFSEYTQELRMHYVLKKLSDTPHFRNYTLQAIAEEVGYKDANTFVRVFKKQTGLSPNYYIEELQKEQSKGE